MIPIPKTHIAVIRQVCASGPPDFARRVPPPPIHANRESSPMTFHAPPKTQTPMNALPTYSARDLTEGGDLAQIVLDTQTYTLRITRAGKLILTK